MPASNDKKEMGSRDFVSLSGTIIGKEKSIIVRLVLFIIKDLAKSIVSAGKSWQLMRFVSNFLVSTKNVNYGLCPY